MKRAGVLSIWNNSESGPYRITVWHHIIFWGLYFMFNTLRWGSYFDDYDYSFKTNILSFASHIPLAYFNVYYLMPKLIYTRRYGLYGLAVLGCLFLSLFFRFYTTYYLFGSNVWPEGPELIDHITLNYAIQMMIGELYVMSFVTAIKITIDWLQEKHKIHDLEKRQLVTELRFLRTQVSPHFFFNTLNNIYSLTLEKSDKAPQLVLKLSNLMRYLLYATKESTQPLIREIENIHNYVEIERVRFDNELELDITVEGDFEDATIAPMLLMPLVENAFKHGANKSIHGIDIKIQFRMIDDFLHFEISNAVPLAMLPEPEKEGGIGLHNVQKRLELGYAKQDYNFNIEKTSSNFKVGLNLKVK
jgi:two-component system, LytTR family, sensor kinase